MASKFIYYLKNLFKNPRQDVTTNEANVGEKDSKICRRWTEYCPSKVHAIILYLN